MHAGEHTRKHMWLTLLTLVIGYAIYGAVASMGLSLLFLVLTALLAAYQATIGRRCHPVLCILPALVSVAVALFLSPTVEAGLLALAAFILGILLGEGARRGEGRAMLAATATVGLLAVLVALGAYRLLLISQETGQTDILACLHDTLTDLRNTYAEFQREGIKFVAYFAEQAGEIYPLPTDGALLKEASYVMSLMPGVLLLLCSAYALGITYLMQLFAMAANDRSLFSRKNAVYELSAVSAVLYLLAQLILLFHNQPSSVLSLTCINTVILLCPMLVFAKCRDLPRLFGFLRRFTTGGLDFAVWGILTVMFFVLYLSYLLPILAIWQAISILRSMLAPSRADGPR